MAYRKGSFVGKIKDGPRNTPPGKAVPQGKDVFPSAYAGPKKAKAKGKTTNSVNDNKA